MTANGKIQRLVFLVQGLEPHLVQLEPTADGLMGWKSQRPNHTKLITSDKMTAVTKIGVSSSLLRTGKEGCGGEESLQQRHEAGALKSQ